MADDVENAEWVEVPGNNGTLSQLRQETGSAADPHDAAGATRKEKSSGGIAKTAVIWGKRALIALGGLFLLLIVIGYLQPVEDAPSSQGGGQSDIATGANDGPSGLPKQLVGMWIGSESGGTDGLTNCDEAATNEAFIRRQGDRLGLMRFDQSGSFSQFFVDSNVDAQIKTVGTWVANGDILSTTTEKAWLGKMADDINNLPSKPNPQDLDTQIKSRFEGPHVLILTNVGSGTSNRLVRCR